MTEWQPIETAPKDESRFLAFAPDAGIQVARWFAWGDGTGYFECLGDSIYSEPTWDQREPTHWMPLPEPPK